MGEEPVPGLLRSLSGGSNEAEQWRRTLGESRVRAHVAFAGSQDYRVWGRALCKDPISTFFPSATPKSLIVWPQTKYFETTPLQPVFSEPGCFAWVRTRALVEIG